MLFRIVFLALLFIPQTAYLQEDSTYVEEEFDFSDFELAAEPVKSFCSNKVLGQSPTSLINVYYDFQATHDLTAGAISNQLPAQESTINSNQGFGLSGNFPILSRNNILINFGVSYSEHRYNFDDFYIHPLLRNLDRNPLRSIGTQLTVFKPLNDKRFILAQAGLQLNGDYTFPSLQPAELLRFPAALLYGFKPNDRLIWAVGAARTYLGGALNYLPIIYYYHTFNNQKWGIEAVVPSRLNLRYRANSKNIFMLGWNVTGATYHLANFRGYEEDYMRANGLPVQSLEDNIELRRSELRIGATWQRAITDFVWASLETGARVNWLFNVDEDEFFRGFDDSDFYIENNLGTPLYIRLNLSFVSP